MTVSFNAFANIKTVAKYADNLSPYEYANLVNEFGKEKFGYEDNHYYSAAELEAFKNGTAGFDYSREIFRTAVTQNYELSIAGGGEKTTFLASLRYQDDKGIIKESDSQIYSWRLKMDTKIKKWLTAGLNIYGHYRNNTAPRITQYDGLIQQAMYFPSTISPKRRTENITTLSLRAVQPTILWDTFGNQTTPTRPLIIVFRDTYSSIYWMD